MAEKVFGSQGVLISLRSSKPVQDGACLVMHSLLLVLQVECEDQQCQVPEDREKSWKELQQTKDRCTSSTAHQGAVVQEGLGHTSVRLTDFIQRASTMVLAILSGNQIVLEGLYSTVCIDSLPCCLYMLQRDFPFVS